jgi:hypothetical protein
MNDTFLHKVKKHNTRLFIVMVLFALGTLLCNLTGNEVTPFFVWGMYSAKEPPVEQYELLQTTINDSMVLDVDDYYNNTRFYLGSPLTYYKRIKDNQGIDPTVTFLQEKLHQHYNSIRFAESKLFNTGAQQQLFMNWFARYISIVNDVPVTRLRVDVVKVHFNGAHLVTDSVYLFEQWKKP